MAEFPGARDRFVDESRVWIDQNDHATIVIHGTGGNPNQTADQLGDYFETTSLKTSVHYGIDRMGNIDQYVLEKNGCGGEGILDPGHDPFWDQYSDNPNWHSLGVETENDLTNSLPLTDPQKATLFRLVAYWVAKYNIPLSNIKGHFSLEPVNRADCPGPNFPWQELFDYLANGGNDMSQSIDLTNAVVALYFTGNNDVWKCKSNGFLVGHAILAFYRRFGGDGLCGLTYLGLPLSGEIGGIPNAPGVVYQRFERGVLCFDPQHTLDNPPGSGDVYLLHIDKGIGEDPRVEDLQAQIQALQPTSQQAEISALEAKINQAVKDLS